MLTSTSDREGDTLVIPPCTGSHSPDPDRLSKAKVAACAISPGESERILADFNQRYVGPAHGIIKAELEVKDDVQRILVHVSDWNGVLNIPANFQGMAVAFTQYVPPGAIWQL